MKKVINFLFCILILSSFASAVDCPRGLENETYPGSCGLYTDANKDGICDLSQDLSSNTGGLQFEKPNYYMWQIAFIFIILYFLSFGLVKSEVISYVLHKKIWNSLLLISFIITAITSVFILLRLNYGFSFSTANASFWHIEIGWIMILISIFHILWHLPYFKNLLRL